MKNQAAISTFIDQKEKSKNTKSGPELTSEDNLVSKDQVCDSKIIIQISLISHFQKCFSCRNQTSTHIFDLYFIVDEESPQ